MEVKLPLQRKGQAMDISVSPALERVARVLAARRISINGAGDEASAASEVDSTWRDFEEDAIAVLKTLREPDEEMAAAGDAAIWSRMIAVALGQDPGAGHAAETEDLDIGSAPLIEGP
ncbi:hypothetical protein [Sphingomonas sp. ID0503]|uniref:hypothetical protein n=1 Tax=Sphingomonas sp. ID0503 TaxID=3399691 RepID=UPI003AFAAD66